MKRAMNRLSLAKTISQGLGTLSVSALLTVLPVHGQAATIVNDWKPIFEGIEFATGMTDGPVLQKINGLKIDLFSPDIQFFSTPSNGSLPEETIAQTTSQFLDEFDLQVAVNANFFAPCCIAAPEAKDIIGLAISTGGVVSPSDGLISGNIGEVPDSLLITADNQAEITSTIPGDDFSDIFTAVSAGPRLLVDGEIVVDEIPSDGFSDLNPRTAAGLSQDEQHLILMAIDDRQSGISEGATLFQTAEWLLRFGAYQGLNLDGGGSTTMVREDEVGNPLILNIPSSDGGAERFHGNNFGVFASPLSRGATSVPESNTLGFIAVVSVCLALLRTEGNGELA